MDWAPGSSHGHQSKGDPLPNFNRHSLLKSQHARLKQAQAAPHSLNSDVFNGIRGDKRPLHGALKSPERLPARQTQLLRKFALAFSVDQHG